ncbi:thiopeptide-type bacteriocin biosynthesis protein (plasmid) [Streptomyces sp. CA-142005]|uniref:thiopeptide-type bacteriocin biosynthesis protein n=1 Tax=Streptomyces sp. CA-142005 TaxID=3240052 RepID=UPI003D8AACFB
MQRYDNPTENAVLAVLGGIPIEEAARQAPTSPARLAEAVERYRAAGRSALEPPPSGWYQAYVSFADYPSAARTFRTYLLPTLSNDETGAWWFVRKYPFWRLRVQPPQGAQMDRTIARTRQALDSAVSWGVVKQWRTSLYEPESIAFGGLVGMTIAHSLFHADSTGVLTYDQLVEKHTAGLFDAKVTSLLVVAVLLRAAGLEWGEQGDVWGQVEARRPLPEDIPTDKVSGMVDPMRKLLTLDPGRLLTNGPLTPLQDWVTGMKHAGTHLKDAAELNRLGLGLRSILARHIIFHWNRMGFSNRQQAIWSRAAREAVLGQ